MLLSVVIYLFSYEVITRSSEEIYTASMERSCAEIDGIIRSVFQTLDYLVINSNVQKLSFVKNSLDPHDHWAIIQLVRELKNYQLVLPYIYDLFVVLNETGTIVSTIGHIEDNLYYSLNYENKGFDNGSFQNLIRKNHRKPEAYPAEKNLLFFRTVPDSNLSINPVSVGAVVRQSKLMEPFIENGPVIYIRDRDSGNEYFAPDSMSGAYRSVSIDSNAINWRYVCLFPVSILKERARKIQLVTFIGFVICFLLGLSLSYILSRMNYEPVNKLMSYFMKESLDTRLAIRKYHSLLRYSRETEQHLVNMIRAGDSEGVKPLLRQVYTENRFPEDPSGRMQQFLAYDLLGTIVKGIGQAESDFPDDINIEEIPVSELPAFVEETALSACENNRETVSKKNIKSLCENVMNYLKENFRDADLNISQTGYHFDISPFYLSSIFREETGQSLLDYLNSLRIEEGKRLLAEGHNLTEIAGMTGFHGSAAFIRVFKKITGITPGQYRKIS